MKRKPRPQIVIRIEGGQFQGCSSSVPMDVMVSDDDNLACACKPGFNPSGAVGKRAVASCVRDAMEEYKAARAKLKRLLEEGGDVTDFDQEAIDEVSIEVEVDSGRA